MAFWRPLPSSPPGGLTYESVVRAIKTTVGDDIADLKQQVRELGTDRITRADLNALRDEMRDGFSAGESKFYTRAEATLRYEEVNHRLNVLEGGAQQTTSNSFTLSNYRINWLLTAVGILVGLGSLAIHFIH